MPSKNPSSRKSVAISTIFDAVTIAASGNASCAAQDLSYDVGFYSLQLHITGDGTCKVDVLLSNDGTNFLIPEGDSSAAANLTKSSGSSGKVFIKLNTTPWRAKAMKIKITETGTAQSVTVTGYLASL